MIYYINISSVSDKVLVTDIALVFLIDKILKALDEGEIVFVFL